MNSSSDGVDHWRQGHHICSMLRCMQGRHDWVFTSGQGVLCWICQATADEPLEAGEPTADERRVDELAEQAEDLIAEAMRHIPGAELLDPRGRIA